MQLTVKRQMFFSFLDVRYFAFKSFCITKHNLRYEIEANGIAFGFSQCVVFFCFIFFCLLLSILHIFAISKTQKLFIIFMFTSLLFGTLILLSTVSFYVIVVNIEETANDTQSLYIVKIDTWSRLGSFRCMYFV